MAVLVIQYIQCLLPITAVSAMIHVPSQQISEKCVATYATLMELKMRIPHFKNQYIWGSYNLETCFSMLVS